MRNLKKVLALALAVVMLVGMMVVGAGAAGYADVADSDYGTAIAVVSAIKALEGSNGNFRPDGRLTRADAAVIAARVALQRENANKLAAVTAAYTDVSPKAYYAGAIAWATNEGILSGDGSGSFNPNGSLTGYAFAKMMLGVLGYDAEIEGYQNDKNYLVNINYDAAKAGLLTGLESLDLGAKMTRGQAAQMAFNAIQAQRVEGYTTTVMPVNGEWTAIQTASIPDAYNNSLLDDVYTALHYNEYDSAPNTPAYVQWTMDGALAPIATEVLLAPIAINAKTDLSKLDLIGATVEANVNGVPTGTDLTSTDEITDLCVPGNTVEIYVDTNKIVAVNVTSETLLAVAVDFDEATEIYTFDLSTIAGETITDSVTFDKAEDADNTLYNALVALNLNILGDKILVSTYAGEIVAVEKAITSTGKVTKYVEGEAVTVNGVEYALAGQYVQTNAIAVKAEQVLYLDNNGNVLTAVNVPTAPVVPNTIYVAKVTTTPVWVEDVDAGTPGNQPGYTTDGTFTVSGFDLAGEAVTIITDGSASLQTLYTYTDADADGVYTLASAGTLQDNSAAAANDVIIYANDVMETTDTYFFAENVTFLYIYDTADADSVVSVNGIYNGVQKVVGPVDYIYVKDALNLVTHVIVKGAHFEATVYEDGVIYLAAQIDSTNVDYYAIAEDGKTVTSNHVVLMDGEEFVVTQAKGYEETYTAGFYVYTLNSKGLATLAPWTDDGYANVYTGEVIDGTTNKIQLVNGNYYLTIGSKMINITDADIYSLDLETACSSVARLYTLATSAKYGDVTISLNYYYESGLNFGLTIYVNDIEEI